MWSNKWKFGIVIILSPIVFCVVVAGVKIEKYTDYEKLFTYDGKVYKPGDTVYGFKQYVKLVVGDDDSPLLLGVPHDGNLAGDPEIPEIGNTGRDINTLPLALEIAKPPAITVRNNAAVIEVSGPRFSRAIVNYLNKWYGYNFKNK